MGSCMGLFLKWRHKLLCIAIFKELPRCKTVCDVISGIGLCPYLLDHESNDDQFLYLYRPIKLHTKPNLFLHSCKIYRLKCRIPKFEMSRTKIDDFASAESWAILPREMVRGLDRVCCEIPWLWRNFGDRSFVYARWFHVTMEDF